MGASNIFRARAREHMQTPPSHQYVRDLQTLSRRRIGPVRGTYL